MIHKSVNAYYEIKREEVLFMEWEFLILDWFQKLHTPVLTAVMKFITFLGEGGWFWILLGLVLVCTKKYRRCGMAVIFALLLDLVLVNILVKPLAARPRPCQVRDGIELLVRVPRDYSFPSGHAAASFASAAALYLTEKKFGIAALVLSVLMGISRMYFYVHFPTDVLAGAVLGILCGVAAVFLVKKIPEKKKSV